MKAYTGAIDAKSIFINKDYAMKGKSIVIQAHNEVNCLIHEINKVIKKYIDESGMDDIQKTVNVGRALNWHHINYVSKISKQDWLLDQLSIQIEETGLMIQDVTEKAKKDWYGL